MRSETCVCVIVCNMFSIHASLINHADVAASQTQWHLHLHAHKCVRAALNALVRRNVSHK